jgi:hypothetical protein
VSDRPATIYSNILKVRTTETELVFEFGSHFPEQPGEPPGDPESVVRIVMPIGALEALSKALAQAVQRASTESIDEPPASKTK